MESIWVNSVRSWSASAKPSPFLLARLIVFHARAPQPGSVTPLMASPYFDSRTNSELKDMVSLERKFHQDTIWTKSKIVSELSLMHSYATFYAVSQCPRSFSNFSTSSVLVSIPYCFGTNCFLRVRTSAHIFGEYDRGSPQCRKFGLEHFQKNKELEVLLIVEGQICVMDAHFSAGQ